MGGGDSGYCCYRDGKLEKRTNTFNDFVDCARGLIQAGFAAPCRLAIQCGSAGGELMGAVVNAAPDLRGAVVANVPFGDVLSTLLTVTLPITPGAWHGLCNPLNTNAAFPLIR